MRVVRELTESRSKLVAGKCVMAEKFAELQQEYMKVLRIADLSRTASRNNLAKADRATNLAKQVGQTEPGCFADLAHVLHCQMLTAAHSLRQPACYWVIYRLGISLQGVTSFIHMPAAQHHCLVKSRGTHKIALHVTDNDFFLHHGLVRPRGLLRSPFCMERQGWLCYWGISFGLGLLRLLEQVLSCQVSTGLPCCRVELAGSCGALAPQPAFAWQHFKRGCQLASSLQQLSNSLSEFALQVTR